MCCDVSRRAGGLSAAHTVLERGGRVIFALKPRPVSMAPAQNSSASGGAVVTDGLVSFIDEDLRMLLSVL